MTEKPTAQPEHSKPSTGKPKEPSTGKPKDKQSLLARFATWLAVDSPQGLTHQLFVVILFLFALYLAAFILLGWAQSCDGKQWLQITVAAMLISAASVGVGWVLGFLFGLPRSIEKAEDPGLHGYLSNTNLLDVSDWLTKIIVGISLVQIGNLPSALGRLGRSIAPMLGYSPQPNPSCAAAVITSEGAIGGIGVAMCLSTLVIAFSSGYLFTRVILLRVLRQAEQDETENDGQPPGPRRGPPRQVDSSTP
jgi:hypothetical protein